MSAKGTPRKPEWSAAELAELRERYERHESLGVISAAMRRTRKAVSTRAGRIGLASRQSPAAWTPEEDDFLRKHYETMPTVEIARALGRGHATIKVHADKFGLLSQKRRAHAAVRHDYFSSIDSHLKAYILGLLASDGWVSSDHNEIGIALHTKDRSLVELVRAELTPLGHIGQGGTPASPRAELRVSSAQMRADLIRLGVTPRKSRTLRWPTGLTEKLNKSFILGCFDGDGCLYYDRRTRYYRWSLVSGSRHFLEDVRARIISGTGVRIQGPYALSRSSAASVIQYKGPRIYDLDQWMHAEVAGLERKRPVTQAQ